MLVKITAYSACRASVSGCVCVWLPRAAGKNLKITMAVYDTQEHSIEMHEIKHRRKRAMSKDGRCRTEH